MRVLGMILKIIAYIAGLNAIFYNGIIPAIGGIWSWSEWGLSMVLGLLFSILCFGIGNWLRNKRRMTEESK